MLQPTALVFSPDGARLPETLRGWLGRHAFACASTRSADDLMHGALRGRPRVVIFDARAEGASAFDACRRLKVDSYTGIVPTAVLCRRKELSRAFGAGADEVLHEALSDDEILLRLEALLRRSDRDVHTHPSTRLPGTIAIEAHIAQQIDSDASFAVCYADLDHFKEFNDRYSYAEGDRVIGLLARILHDVVKGLCGEQGFIGHIGGDDFIFIVPLTAVAETCEEIVSVFDTLIPYQYSEQDRRAAYFFGKDRRGHLHRVPLMTLSIGVVTNERRRFTSAAQVSELATEMKSYAKTLPGSLYAVDRRQDPCVGGGSYPAPSRDAALSRVDET